MVAELRKLDKSLYETDYNLWVLETVSQLQRRDLEGLDWENLIEEVIDLSRRDKRKLKSLLRLLFEHLLKLAYWHSEVIDNQAHWRGEILNFRQQIKDDLEDSPSLRNYLSSILETCYQEGRAVAAQRSQLPLSHFPDVPIATLDQVLDEAWFPPSLED